VAIFIIDMISEKDIFQRTELLLGEEAIQKIGSVKVILFGVGGVGSWCAESLVRSGIRHLTIVDSDNIHPSNINRQLHATTTTINMSKVEVMKQRLLEINPYAEITALHQVYNSETAESFELNNYDYIIDAIDTLSNKIDLIRKATRTKAEFFSSMGAGLKIDPTRIRVAEFWKVKGCPLGHFVRKKIRKGDLPAKKFMCVYSEELLENKGGEKEKEEISGDQQNIRIPFINGTLVHMTAIFGFTLAGLVIQDINLRLAEA
jgi:tRNA A37 threonylcarbamoyladenosine dehydratase